MAFIAGYLRSLLNPVAGMSTLYIVAFVLAVAAGAAFWADPLCRYGGAFCQHPSWLAAAAMLALVWAQRGEGLTGVVIPGRQLCAKLTKEIIFQQANPVPGACLDPGSRAEARNDGSSYSAGSGTAIV